MKNISALAILLLAGISAQATFLPPTEPQNKPFLVCEELNAPVAADKIFIEIAAGNEEFPLPFLTVNNQHQTLYSGEVNQTSQGNKMIYFADHMKMEFISSRDGNVDGRMFVGDNERTQEIALKCNSLYYIQPQPGLAPM